MAIHESANNQLIIDYIIQSINEGIFQENSRIPTENELAEKFSVSRGSVREALKILQFIGILNSNQGSGYKISDNLSRPFSVITKLLLDMQHFTYKDISDIREALEIKALLLIQQSVVSSDSTNYLLKCINNMKIKENAIQADIAFHQKLADLSGNVLISNITHALSKISEKYILIPWENMDIAETNDLIQSHIDIINALNTKTPIIADNPISVHYKLADNIINKREKLFTEASYTNYSVKELVELGLSTEEITNIINNMRKNV